MLSAASVPPLPIFREFFSPGVFGESRPFEGGERLSTRFRQMGIEALDASVAGMIPGQFEERDNGISEIGFALELSRLASAFLKIFKAQERSRVSFYGTTLTQCLTILSFKEVSCLSMHQLSDAVGLASSTMTRVVDRLVAKGLTRRFVSDSDRRQVCVELTEKGRETLQQLRDAQVRFFIHLAREIPADKREEMHGALQSLNRVLYGRTPKELLQGL
jgi:DNA-binding MarR family transcriptional regulator